MKQHFLFMNGGIPNKFTGIESAFLKHFKLVTQNLNITPIYLYMYYDLDLPKKIKSLKASGHIPENFCYVNLYEFFLRDCNSKRQLKQNLEIKGDIFSWNNNGKKRITKVYDKETRVPAFTNFYDDNGICYRMDKYDNQGCLSISIIFTDSSSKRKTADYYRQDGSLAISIYYGEKENQTIINQIVLFDNNSVPIQSFHSEHSLHTYLLCYYLNSLDYQEEVNLFINKDIKLYRKLIESNIKTKLKIYLEKNSD